MIEPKHLYDHDGYLVYQEGLPYGIFMYHDIGTAPGYKPWDKIRIFEAYYSKSYKGWTFGKRRPKTQTGHGSRAVLECVGVPTPLFKDFVDATTTILSELLGQKVSVAIPDVPTPIATEADQVDKLMGELGLLK